MNYNQRLKQLNSKANRKEVKRRIRYMGYTQMEIAERMEIPLSTLGKWLNNRQGMSPDRVFALAEWAGLETKID